MFDPVLTGNEVAGSYEPGLVFLSYAIAVFASFTALDLAIRIGESYGITRKIWLGGCSVSMGGGIWTMHFIAMLAFKLPLSVSYNIWITLLSLITAVVASGIAFFYANAGSILISRIVTSGLIMGCGVAAMHYTGMAAMEFAGSLHYKSGLFALSILIAIFAATAALGLIAYFGKNYRVIKTQLKIAAALIMGVAVFGMHYTGMAATIFVPQGSILAEVQSTSDVKLLAFSASGIAILIFGLAIIASITQEEFNRLKGINELILHSIGEGIYGLDVNGLTTFTNPAAEKMLGYSLEEMLGQSPHALIHHTRPDGTTYPSEECLIYLALRDGAIHRISDEVFWKKDGSSFPVEYISTPIFENREIKGAVVSFTDISDRKQAEADRNRSYQKVMESEKLAGIGELAAGVCHEVLNPLNIISASVQLLQRKRQDDEALQTFCAKARNEIRRIDKIMGSLLTFSRKGDSEMEETSVENMLAETVALIGNDCALDNIKVLIECAPATPSLWLDKDKMRQVLLNIANNARHAMLRGGTLTFGCEPLNNEGEPWVRLRITDTGEGMSPENLENIFDPFFTTKPEGEGTGMGLSVVHGIVQEHGGAIFVESELGKGTAFFIDLPAKGVVKTAETGNPAL